MSSSSLEEMQSYIFFAQVLQGASFQQTWQCQQAWHNYHWLGLQVLVGLACMLMMICQFIKLSFPDFRFQLDRVLSIWHT